MELVGYLLKQGRTQDQYNKYCIVTCYVSSIQLISVNEKRYTLFGNVRFGRHLHRGDFQILLKRPGPTLARQSFLTRTLVIAIDRGPRNISMKTIQKSQWSEFKYVDKTPVGDVGICSG